MYDAGQGMPQSFKEAAVWYRKAADQGDADAQFNLGVMYDKGRGVLQSDKEAAVWDRKAADQGHAGALFKASRLAQWGYLIMGRIGICQVSDPTTEIWEMLRARKIKLLKC